jgi:hypothetical protein
MDATLLVTLLTTLLASRTPDAETQPLGTDVMDGIDISNS